MSNFYENAFTDLNSTVSFGGGGSSKKKKKSSGSSSKFKSKDTQTTAGILDAAVCVGVVGLTADWKKPAGGLGAMGLCATLV